MSPLELATYAYDHGGDRAVSRERVAAMVAIAGLAILGGLIARPLFLGLLVPPLVYLSAPRVLYLGSRYLICDRQIVYYASVSRLVRSDARGELRVESDLAVFTLRSDQFPTNARKAEKIAANRARKFQKVASKIGQRVRAAAPGARVEGDPS